MRPAIGLTILAVFQLAGAILLWGWAWPLFGDPPVLGNGIGNAAATLNQLALQDPEGFKHIDWVGRHLQWLFARHSEGVLIALGAALAGFFSAAATGFFAFTLFRASNAALLHEQQAQADPTNTSQP